MRIHDICAKNSTQELVICQEFDFHTKLLRIFHIAENI